MSAAYQIVGEGGLIICAVRCNDGFPEHGNFRKMLLEYSSPEAMLEAINSPGFSTFDQWQVQLFAQILQRARVALYSEIDAEAVRSVHLEGPMTVPYLEHAPIRA